MDRMIYTAMQGAKQVMLRQASNSHNLANVSTTGFRADLDAFKSLPVYGPGHPSRVAVEDRRAGVDFAPGSIVSTGRALDVAINGSGFIAVQGADGREAYTRAGDLHISAGGLLETGTGHLVLGNGGPVALPPAETIEIAADGTISIRPVGQAATSLALVDRIKLVDPPLEELEKTAEGLFARRDGAPEDADAAVKLANGALESSNVNAVDALVNMIELSRQYELNVRLMHVANQTDEASARLLRLS